MPSDIWSAIAAVASALSAGLLLISFWFLAAQAREAKNAALGQSFLGIVGIIQAQEMRETRRRMFALSSVPIERWTPDNVVDVERVCQSYDIFGILCRNKLIPSRLVVESWGDSITRVWAIGMPYVKKLRVDRGAPEFWQDLEWLATRAKEHRRTRIV